MDGYDGDSAEAEGLEAQQPCYDTGQSEIQHIGRGKIPYLNHFDLSIYYLLLKSQPK